MKVKYVRKFIITSMIATIIASNYTIVNADSFKVFIDPGHGGVDNGSSHYGYFEDNINLQIANKVKDKLTQEGIGVVISRTNDTYVPLSKRVEMSNNSDADIFISIHQNAAPNVQARGIETYYMGSQNKLLADHIQSSMVDYTEATNRGSREGNLYVLRNNSKPSVLIESGFISNSNESYLLNTYSYQNKIANGIVSGIKRYFNINSNTVKHATVLKEDGIEVMSDRGKYFDVLGVLQEGTKVEVIDTKFDWHKIKYGDRYGYVSGVYVK